MLSGSDKQRERLDPKAPSGSDAEGMHPLTSLQPDADTIVAPATPPGGALAIVRLSGPEAIAIADRIFRGRRTLAATPGGRFRYGRIVASRPAENRSEVDGGEACRADGGHGQEYGKQPGNRPERDGRRKEDCGSGRGQEGMLDDAVAAVYRAPHSYTGEDSVEFTCHGSPFVVSEMLRLLLAAGARMARPGEFTVRAYLSGRLDLTQAEAVADLVAASSRAEHALATTQMRGGYAAALDALREALLQLASLVELELDFAEEDVRFADRDELRATMLRIRDEIEALRRSFAVGNAIRQGVAVAIAGAPNVGKSTLLNRLLADDRALVSEIAGTTRDVVEERLDIGGIPFRLLDTAGIRATRDRLEQMGIRRTMESIDRARIVLLIATPGQLNPAVGCEEDGPTVSAVPASASGSLSAPSEAPDIVSEGSALAFESPADSAGGPAAAPHFPEPRFPLRDDQTLIRIVNKIDTAPGTTLPEGVIGLSAKTGEGIEKLREALCAAVPAETVFHGSPVVSNARHFEALDAACKALDAALDALAAGLPADLLSEEIREVTRHLNTILCRGVIAPDDILKRIFSTSCIGK